MAIGKLTYLDLTPEQRREGAKAARERIRNAQMSPALDATQQAYLRSEAEKINAWEKCKLDCAEQHDPKPT